MKAILKLELSNQSLNGLGKKPETGSLAPTPSSCLHLWQQLRHSKQVIGSSHEPSSQLRPELSLKPCLPKPSNHLDPAPNLFNSFPNSLADLVAPMTRRPAINRRSSSSLRVLGHVRSMHSEMGCQIFQSPMPERSLLFPAIPESAQCRA